MLALKPTEKFSIVSPTQADSVTVSVEPESTNAVLSKKSIRIAPQVNEDKNEMESNTVLLSESIKGFEECVLTITPKQDKEIENIISVNVILKNYADGLYCVILDLSENKKSFSLYVKNNNENDLENVKVSYTVNFK